MFEVGWTEMLVIAIVMIVVVGPKDLPKMLRTFGRTTAKMRQMAGDFQKQFNEALQEAELDEVKKSVDSLRELNPATQIKKQLNPFEKAAADVRAGLGSLNPSPPPKPASTEPQPAEPLKNGATEMPAAMMTGAPVSAAEAAPVAAPVKANPAAAKPAAKPAVAKAPTPVVAKPSKPASANAPRPAAKPAKPAAKPKPAKAKA